MMAAAKEQFLPGLEELIWMDVAREEGAQEPQTQKSAVQAVDGCRRRRPGYTPLHLGRHGPREREVGARPAHGAHADWSRARGKARRARARARAAADSAPAPAFFGAEAGQQAKARGAILLIDSFIFTPLAALLTAC